MDANPELGPHLLDPSLDSLVENFHGAVSIAPPQETDIDAIMPPPPQPPTPPPPPPRPQSQSPVRPDCVPSLQLGLDDEDEDNFELLEINNSSSTRRSGGGGGGGKLSDRSSSRAFFPPLVLRRLMQQQQQQRQRTRRRSVSNNAPTAAVSTAGRSLPCSPRFHFPPRLLLRSSRVPPQLFARTTVSEAAGLDCAADRLRALVDRANALQKSLDAIERRRRLAWEARQLLADSQDLRRSVGEFLHTETPVTGSAASTPRSATRPPRQRQHSYLVYSRYLWQDSVLQNSMPPSSSTLSSPRGSGSAVDYLNSLVKIRRDIVRRSMVAVLQRPTPVGSGCYCFADCGGGFGVVACR